MSPSRRKRALLLVGLALAAVSVYASSLRGDFVWDDQILIVNNHQIRSWDHLGEILSTDFFHINDEPTPYGYYRPVITLSYLLSYQLWELRPLGYHLTNLLLHAGATVLVVLLLGRLGFGFRFSLVVALLFAVHPIHTENVAWIAGRTDLVAFVLTAAAFLLHLMATRGPGDETSTPTRPRMLLALSLVAFGLGLLAKEMSVVLLAWLALVHRIQFGHSWRAIGLRLTPFVLVFLGYCTWRFWFLEVEVPTTPPEHRLPLALLSALPTVLRYLGWMLLPVDPSAYVQNPYTESIGEPRFLGALLVLSLLGVLVWRFMRDRKGLLVVGMLATSFLPLLNLVRIAGPSDMGNVMAERFCYFPSFPFLVALSLLVARVLGESRQAPFLRPLGLGLVAVVVGLATVRTVTRIPDWRDDHAFVTRALEQSPEAPLLWKVLAKCRLRTALRTDYIRSEMNWRQAPSSDTNFDDVVDAFRKSIELDPRDLGTHHNLGVLLYWIGDLDGAIEALREAISLKPDYVRAHINLGAVLHDRGEVDAAIKEYRAAIRILRESELLSNRAALVDYSAAQYNLGRALLDREDIGGALPAFREALGIRPDLIGAFVGQALMQAKNGNTALAFALLQEAVETQPRYLQARVQYASLLASTGRTVEARALIEEGIGLAGSSKESGVLSGILQELQSAIDPASAPAKRTR